MDTISIKEQLYNIRFWFSWADPTTIKKYTFDRTVDLPFIPSVGQEFFREGMESYTANADIGLVKRVQVYLPYERYSDDVQYARAEVEVNGYRPKKGETVDEYTARLRKDGWYLMPSKS